VGGDTDIDPDLKDAEIAGLVAALRARHGHDFSEYTRASLRRRLRNAVSALGVADYADLQRRVLREPDLLRALLDLIVVRVTSLFRDPEVFAALGREVLPVLTTYPRVGVWVAGCATGEEVYSLAILLHEAGLLKRTRIYATDLSAAALERARDGVYPAAGVREATAAYLEAGGQASFADYYTAAYGRVSLAPFLRRDVVFSDHSLATDSAFAEVQLVMCRNVLIYFQPKLQSRAVGVFLDSLARRGFLCLGTRESLLRTGHAEAFETVDEAARLYRRR
jgi:chemotaxis protein methyltransferase CheR